MADVDKTRDEPIAQFWDMAEHVSAGMLGLESSDQHMQPMHPNCDPERSAIWFFTKTTSDLAEAARSGGTARFVVIGPHQDYHASVAGNLTVERNAAAIDRYWSPVVEAWFKGKDDPEITMLRLALEDGVAWASVDGERFGWEIAKANTTDQEPDVGRRQHFSFKDQAKEKAMVGAAGTTGGAGKLPRQDGQF